jgi:hypothetical protein
MPSCDTMERLYVWLAVKGGVELSVTVTVTLY